MLPLCSTNGGMGLKIWEAGAVSHGLCGCSRFDMFSSFNSTHKISYFLILVQANTLTIGISPGVASQFGKMFGLKNVVNCWIPSRGYMPVG